MENASEDVLVVGIAGSLREFSRTRMAVRAALRGAESVGARTRLLDLRDYALPFCDDREDESSYPPGVARLRADVRAAAGIVLGTPEYHSGYSGVLKNALDLMGFDEFEGKMVGLVGVSGGGLGAVNGLNGLRTVGRSLHAWVVPTQASVPRASRAFDDDGKPLSADDEERLLAVGREVARFAVLHTSRQALEFLRTWEKAHENPGGE